MLDTAQDYALYRLHQLGLFDQGLVFKGGTALRKFRAGNSGRFSTDLDFAAPDEPLALPVLDALDGTDIDGFTFALANIGDDGRRADLTVGTPFGAPGLGAKVELARTHHSKDYGLVTRGIFASPGVPSRWRSFSRKVPQAATQVRQLRCHSGGMAGPSTLMTPACWAAS